MRFCIPSASEVFLDYYKEMVEERGCVYEPHEEIESKITSIGQWIEDPTAPFGLFLGGRPGNGKTTAVKALKLLIGLSGYRDPVNLDTYGHPEAACLHIVNAYDLAKLYTDNEHRFNFLKKTGILAIDDVGVEPLDYTKYGNVINPFLDILYARYEKKLMTIITTNLKKSELHERYGARYADRAEEMFFRVAFPYGVTFRHNNYNK